METAASVIAVIQLLDRVATQCYQYAKAVRDAKSDIERLQGELSQLRTILGDTEKLLNGPHGDSLKTSQVFYSTIRECTLQLQDLEQTLRTRLEIGSSKGKKLMTRFGLRALKWPFEQEDMNRIAQTLNKSRDILSAALNIDQTYVSAASFQTLSLNRQ